MSRPKTRIPGSTCRRGHALIGDNVYVTPAGHVQCKRCERDRHEASRLRNQAIRKAIAMGVPEDVLASVVSGERG